MPCTTLPSMHTPMRTGIYPSRAQCDPKKTGDGCLRKCSRILDISANPTTRCCRETAAVHLDSHRTGPKSSPAFQDRRGRNPSHGLRNASSKTSATPGPAQSHLLAVAEHRLSRKGPEHGKFQSCNDAEILVAMASCTLAAWAGLTWPSRLVITMASVRA